MLPPLSPASIDRVILLPHAPAKARENGEIETICHGNCHDFSCRTSPNALKVGRHLFLAPATAKNGRPQREKQYH